MNESLLLKLKEILVSTAIKNEVIEYNKLSKAIGNVISPIKLNEPLGEISLRCIKHGYPPLSVIVVNQQTQLPGEGFFTWVASKMGYNNLPHSRWLNFFNEQKEAVFNINDWDSFLAIYEVKKNKVNIKAEKVSEITSKNIEFSMDTLEKNLVAKSYVMGIDTTYQILTIKEFLETKTLGPYNYKVLLLENHQLLREELLEDLNSKNLLTLAKKKGLELLFQHNPMVKIQDVTMVHYKQDRLKNNPWEKENRTNFIVLFDELENKRLSYIVENDTETEKKQYASSYKDGEIKIYFGNRYERKPINRLRAIELHGITCAVCEFNFEEYYGEHGRDFIEIHHLKPLSTLEKAIEIDPQLDLVPVCPNCHRMLHRRKGNVLSVSELKDIIKKQHN